MDSLKSLGCVMPGVNQWPEEFAAGAALLVKAAKYAEALHCSPWDFATEIGELPALGVSRANLRWLVCQGFLEHAEEIISQPLSDRTFQASGRLAFCIGTCFVLTPIGLSAACLLISDSAGYGESPGQPTAIDPRVDGGNGLSASYLVLVKPQWNCDLKRFSLGELVVKEYRRPAPNQHCILAAFQEEEWPLRIDDPLRPTPDIVPARRLHEAIAALNRCQSHPVLRFSVDACGCGIRWLIVE